MKHLKIIFPVFFILLIFDISMAQKKYKYETFEKDPLGTRIYTLDNGLKIYISVNKTEPRIATRIAVKAGSKNDPSDATGLAHYLEHMLFKGTDRFGSMDFGIEGKLIDEIINLYEEHRAATDPEVRKMIYRKIDSVSYVASGYAIPNEYDKMLGSIGAKGTNAYTSVEQTVYTNDIPSNQFAKWLEIETERFRNPIMRLFHTELEVVYEEKNRSMDNGFSKAYENLYAELFKQHTYGTQTTIGTVEHLKNPSLVKVINYFRTYYVPNNMAIILSGDIDPDEAVNLIDDTFGKFPKGIIPEFIPPSEKEIENPVEKSVYTPEAENVYIGFRVPGINTDEIDRMNVMSSILSNGNAGLIDLNIVKQQKVLSASAFVDDMKDYSAFVLSGSPREGQKPEEVKDLLLSQIELVKKGDFPDWYTEAVVNNYRLTLLKMYQNNNSRVQAYVNAFTSDMTWERYLGTADRYSKIMKKDIVDFANKYFKNNYVVIYKRTGTDKETQKIIKPEITPVQVNRETESLFLKKIVNEPVKDLEPKFVDFKSEIGSHMIKPGIPLYCLKNSENNLFELSLIYEFGNNADKRMAVAINYLKLLGTKTKTNAELSQEFFRIGCSYNITQNGDRAVITLSGLNEYKDQALKLLMEILTSAVPDEKAYKNLVDDVLKSRANIKLSKNAILRNALMNYGMYGPSSPFTNILSEAELKNLNPSSLTDLFVSMHHMEHTLAYYGPDDYSVLKDKIYPYYMTKDIPREVPPNKEFKELPTDESSIYFVDYPMKQVEIMFINRSEKFTKENLPIIRLYNEYFGSGMSSIVFQDLREAKALAYSVSSVYNVPDSREKYHYIVSYIGTQSDKLGEAMNGFFDLMNNIPLSEISFSAAKDGIIKSIQTERLLRNDIMRAYLQNKRLGIDYDSRRDIYEGVKAYTMNDVRKFNENYVKGKKFTYLLIGDSKKLDFSILEKFGKVERLTLEQIFGY